MATSKRRKPVPKTQSQLTREQIEGYDVTRGVVPASSKNKRENQISLKDDTVKLPTVSLRILMKLSSIILKTSLNLQYSRTENLSMYRFYMDHLKDGLLCKKMGIIEMETVRFKYR